MLNSHLLHQVSLIFNDSFQEYRKDLSALRLTPDNHLWFGSDETSSIERLSFVDSQNFAKHKQFRVAEFISLPESEDNEIDIEGIAYDDYYLWFVGSHSWKRKKTKPDNNDPENIDRLTKTESESNRYILGRIPLVYGELLASCPHPQNPDIELSAAKLELKKQGNLLTKYLADDPHLGLFINAGVPGKDNGFDIEGIAVYQNRVFLGLRGPVLRGWAMMLEIELENSSPGLMKLQKIGDDKQRYKKHFVWLNGSGIRDLCLDGDDLLILAGPTMVLDGKVQVYRLRNGVNMRENVLNNPQLLLDLPYGNGNDRPEGITLFQDVTGVSSVLVVYDDPAENRLLDNSGVMADVFSLG
ncbi:DUF3616 domain-containing protein [Halotia branconii]|uniref:DUF3616 domain-containing protein n=1 Tax=Halotia branconii CENA392 TaxID=1539056 RepID=A0AAJ6NMK5_9CYAN|nr:DUF3616 domain-containing protein [Halotia branconii]WGV23290.1 DUF3616 domain-containing protein [Halotia branconii CENA392]